MAGTCSHIQALDRVKTPKGRECEECVKLKSSWVHLRTCLSCGHVIPFLSAGRLERLRAAAPTLDPLPAIEES